VSDAVAAGNKARRLGITCHRHGGGAHDAADAYEADAVAVGGGRRTRRRQQGVVEAVLEAPKVAGVRRGVLPAVGVARLVAAAELGHGRRRPLLGRQQHDDEQAPGGEPLALHCTTTCFFFFCVFPSLCLLIAHVRTVYIDSQIDDLFCLVNE